jgi:hypothetical protein
LLIRKDLITPIPLARTATLRMEGPVSVLIRPPRQTKGQPQVGQITMRRVEILVTFPKMVFVVGLVRANKEA